MSKTPLKFTLKRFMLEKYVLAEYFVALGIDFWNKNKTFVMSRFRGLIKETDYWNRVEQRRDWQKIKTGLEKLGKSAPEPDWNLSVKKADKYFEKVCKENGLPENYWYSSVPAI
jgi:hypothetical protein